MWSRLHHKVRLDHHRLGRWLHGDDQRAGATWSISNLLWAADNHYYDHPSYTSHPKRWAAGSTHLLMMLLANPVKTRGSRC